MGKKKMALAGRAWSLLRLPLLWARKGSALKRSFEFDLRLLPGYLKRIKSGSGRSDRLRYGEREFSFEETPAFHFKTPSMRLPRLPCITPAVDFDNDDDYILFKHEKMEGLFESKTECSVDTDEDGQDNADDVELIQVMEEQGIDSKAEEFIAKFYEQMKLQCQVS